MPNQNYFEARDLKMAQCDLSLSLPSCKSEERVCKLSYSSWCPTCDKESPRRRSKSETNEPCRRKGREMKGLKKCEWNPECENMEFEYEGKDLRYDISSCRIRSNLCELPTTYITNNCQMMKLSSYQTDFVDSSEKGIKCYENSLKTNDFNIQSQNFGSMVDRQDRIAKLYPRIEESDRNVSGIVHKLTPKLDGLKPHIALELKKSKCVKYAKNKPMSGTNSPINYQNTSSLRYNTPIINRDSEYHHGDYKMDNFKPACSLTKSYDLKCQEADAIHYDTCTFFNKKVDIANLRERYSQEVELLKGKLMDLRNNVYDNRPKPFSTPLSCDDSASTNLPTVTVVSDTFKMDMKHIRQGLSNNVARLMPLIPVVDTEIKDLPQSQIKHDRFKSGSKVSLKTKGKLVPTKLRKQVSKTTNIVATSDVLGSECSGSEDSDREDNCESESLDEVSTSSSARKTTGAPVKFGAGDILHWPLRQSLFPNIPPYLSFTSHDVVCPQKISTGGRYLKWKMSTITPILVRKTLTNSGLRLVRSEFSRESNEWIGTWGKHMKSPMFRTLKENQKLNHFPGTFQIGRKDRLWRNLQRLIHKFGQKEFGFTPQTYVLPQDLKLLKQRWLNKNGTGDEKYIIKPPASARGTGIRVINRWSQLPKRMSLVVQEYISNPYLINGSKFDLRLYVLVTSFNPLRIYLYPEGLARFASVPYSDDVKDLKDRYMHLTNYSINKMSSFYTANEDANSCKGHKWTLSKLWEYMGKRGVDTKTLWKNLKQLVIKTIISGESTIVPLCRENMNSRYNCYELFGVDVLLDEHLQSWLLEVNISPSLHSQSPLDEYVKGPMVKTLFDLAQFHLPPRFGRIDCPTLLPCLDTRIYTTTLTKTERNKHNFFCQAENRQEYLEDILVDLTGDDVRHLTQAEDELVVMGRFEKIFPTAHTYKYLDFLDVRYYNRLFDAWECKYEKGRLPGINILQALCDERVHLKVAPPVVLNKNSQTSIPGENNLQASKEHQVESIPLPLSIVPLPVNRNSLIANYTKEHSTRVSPNKSHMDIKSLYDALRIQSERDNMILRPLHHSAYSTQV